MIKTDAAYKVALERLGADKDALRRQEEELRGVGLSGDEIARAMEPHQTFHQQLVEEVEWYEAARRGDTQTILRLDHVGRLLIALRIASGLSQADLARKLGVDESLVSRDERNEYHAITVTRAQQILDAIGSTLTITAELREPTLVTA